MIDIFKELFCHPFSVTGLETITGLYGETVEIPCNIGATKVEDIELTKWKYVSQSLGQWIHYSDTHLSCLKSVWEQEACIRVYICHLHMTPHYK